MLQDNDLIFFESTTAPATPKSLAINGSAYARDFIFCTIPSGVTALTLTIKGSKNGTNFITVGTAVATKSDLERGLMAVPTPLNAFTHAQVIPTITGTASKNLVCGITDAADNTEVFGLES